MAQYETLIPSIERRLSAWKILQEQIAKRPEARVRPTITLSRAFGCEGFPLAEELQRQLEASSGESWGLYDKSLLEKVAADEHMSMSYLANMDKASPFREALASVLPSHRSRDEAFSLVVDHIIRIARLGNAIIVGRGGAIICRQLPNCFHFRLEASFAFRSQSMARRLHVPLEEAERLVHHSEKARDRFVNDYLGANINEVGHYDAVFNNERHTIHEIASAIVSYVKTALPAKK